MHDGDKSTNVSPIHLPRLIFSPRHTNCKELITPRRLAVFVHHGQPRPAHNIVARQIAYATFLDVNMSPNRDATEEEGAAISDAEMGILSELEPANSCTLNRRKRTACLSSWYTRKTSGGGNLTVLKRRRYRQNGGGTLQGLGKYKRRPLARHDDEALILADGRIKEYTLPQCRHARVLVSGWRLLR